MVYKNYELLSKEDQSLYIEIAAMIETYKKEWEVFAPVERVGRVYRAVLDDFPKYFWLNSGYNGVVRTSNGIKKYLFYPNFRSETDVKTISKMRDVYEDTVSKLISTAKRKTASLYEQILFLHDYIVNNTDYDLKAEHAYDAYGCLVLHRAVCAGYSRAFQDLMHRLGVECGRVSGDSSTDPMQDSSHVWNYIKLNDGYYFVDVTWDDPILEGGNRDNLTHSYFCLNYNEMQLTHNFDSDQFIPKQCGDRFDYYKYHGWYLSRYSFSSVKALSERQLAHSDRVSIKFSSRSEANMALRDLFDNEKVFLISGIPERIFYNLSKSGLILTFGRKKQF